MAGGRESRQLPAAAAAAHAAARAQPLLSSLALALAFLSTMPRAAFSNGLDVHPLAENMTCHNVPYPFGIRNFSWPGFEVVCGPNKEAMLPIAGKLYQINVVSVPESYVVIFAGPIRQVCYDRNGKPTPATGTRSMSLEGTPFTFSQRNKLVVVGCNYKLVVNFTRLTSGERPYYPPVNCATSCDSDIISGDDSCSSNEGCCEVAVLANAAQSYTVSFDTTTGNVTSVEDSGTCSSAFFLDEDDHVFSGEKPLKEALLPPGERRMILDWAIGGSSTCDQAQGYDLEPVCKNNASCVDARRGLGYLCKCPQGYEGNPYLSSGCQDIDECQQSDPCTYSYLCRNTPGSYTCSCPENMIGDGHKAGYGCNVSLTLGPPPAQLQGSSVCNNLENNPCTHTTLCKDVQGSALCACPQGMNGDGKKMGSGCQKQKLPLDTILGAGLALVIIITTAVLCYFWAMKKRKLERKRVELFRKNGGLLLHQKFSAITSQEEGLPAKIFSAEELKIATDNYSETRILGRGGQGTVYKGILSDKTVVAIKKSKVFDESQVEQFVNEIAILSQIDHPNVVKLLGCCLETQVPLLVYEFVSNGTLFHHIHNRSVPCSLTWEDSLRIATETANALAYLHSTSSVPIIHRDIKSSNILLDENLVAKIADFGASRSVPFDQTHVTTLIQGTIGYLDPEYFQSSQLNEKSDVYSFGVVLAELLTRQKPISVARPEESRNLAMHVVILFNEDRLLEEVEPWILEEAGKDQLYAFAELSVRCLDVKGEERPSMREVASVLDGLKRSFTTGQNTIKNNVLVKENIEHIEDHFIHDTRPISTLQSSEVSTQGSMEAQMQMLPSIHMPR